MTQAPGSGGPTGKTTTAAQPESREMYAEIGSLVASLAKALEINEADTAAALEQGEITLELARDSNGNAFVAARHGDKTVRVYQGAIKRPGQEPPPKP
jgi:hypothetical protein